jgi:hypothetical protein
VLLEIAIWLFAKCKLSEANNPTFSGLFQLDGPVGVVEELLPTTVAFLTQVDVDKRIVPGLDGLSHQRQARLLGHSAACQTSRLCCPPTQAHATGTGR